MAETFKLRDTICPNGCPEGYKKDVFTKKIDGKLEMQDGDNTVSAICSNCHSSLEIALSPINLGGMTKKNRITDADKNPRKDEETQQAIPNVITEHTRDQICPGFETITYKSDEKKKTIFAHDGKIETGNVTIQQNKDGSVEIGRVTSADDCITSDGRQVTVVNHEIRLKATRKKY